MNIELYFEGERLETQAFDIPPRRDDYVLVSGQLYMVSAICHNTDNSGATQYEVYVTPAPSPAPNPAQKVQAV